MRRHDPHAELLDSLPGRSRSEAPIFVPKVCIAGRRYRIGAHSTQADADRASKAFAKLAAAGVHPGRARSGVLRAMRSRSLERARRAVREELYGT